MAVSNAQRNPKRTARTASSLMIGVALVAFIAVFAASVKTSFGGSLEDTFTGTHIVDSGAFDGRGGFSPELADEMLADPWRRCRSARAGSRPPSVDGSETNLVRLHRLDDRADLRSGTVEGDLAALGADGIAVDADDCRGSRLAASGPPCRSTFAERDADLRRSGRPTTTAAEWLGSEFVDIAAFDEYLPAQLDYRVYAIGDDAAIRDAGCRLLERRRARRRPVLRARSPANSTSCSAVVYALLALAVVIALLGIANTLALSIHERTRELGSAAGGRHGRDRRCDRRSVGRRS